MGGLGWSPVDDKLPASLAAAASGSAPPSDSARRQGPPPGFGKSINDYLNDYVKVGDAKAVAFLVANVTVAALTSKLQPVTDIWQTARWAALISFGGSLFAAAFTLFPRLPKGQSGVIFWEDIRARRSASLYQRDLKPSDAEAVESEYAGQNWLVSRVLHTKYRALQWSVLLFFLGLALSALVCLTL